ncbi:MAG: Fic family protein [Bacteroidetes bacterium]|nr:Fic family protein [Bacteroidota bacterium]
MEPLRIIPADLLAEYRQRVDGTALQATFDALRDAEISTATFSFYTSVSSVFSSKIEGENIELDSYVKHKRDGIEFLPDYTRKIDDLYDAYLFAQGNPLNEQNLAEAHRLLSKHLVAKHYQGRVRTHNMYVSTPDGKIEYVAATPYEVQEEMEKLYADMAVLLNTPLPITDVFFFAAMLHLVFVKIHPFNDGNGRTGRLLEKWFLAQKLGEKTWFIQSEKQYYAQHQTYYRNLRALGLEYQQLDYTKAIPFLLMLPAALLGGH